MSAHSLPNDFADADWTVLDPGDAGTIGGTSCGTCHIVTAGAETRTVEAPLKTGLRLVLVGKTLAGACTIAVTNYVGSDDSLVLSTAGEPIVIESVDVGGTLTWKQTGGSSREAQTITTLSSTLINVATINASTIAMTGDIDLLVEDSASINYEAYAEATQNSSITTTVVCPGVAGIITTVSSTLAAAARAEFTVTNTAVAAGDIVVCTAVTAGAGTPVAYASKTGAGSFVMVLENKHASSALDNTVAISFAVIKMGTAAS